MNVIEERDVCFMLWHQKVDRGERLLANPTVIGEECVGLYRNDGFEGGRLDLPSLGPGHS